MKHSRIPALILLFAGSFICVFLALLSSQGFRSQNLLYHLSFAHLYKDGVLNLSPFPALGHSAFAEQFIDQHFGYHMFLAGLLRFFSDTTVATYSLILGVWLASFALYLLLERKLDNSVPAAQSWLQRGSLCVLCLLPFFLSLRYFERLSTGRPHIFQIAIVCFLLFSLRLQLRMKLIAVFSLSFIWATFSYFSFLALPLSFLFPARMKDRALTFGTSLIAVVLGISLAGGTKVWSYASYLIYAHVFQNSGINEWAQARGQVFLWPLLLCLVALIPTFKNLSTRDLPWFWQKDEESYIAATALAFSVLTLSFSRLYDFSLPLSWLAFALVYLKPALNIHRFSPTFVGLAVTVTVAIRISALATQPISDGTFKPNRLPALATIQSTMQQQKKSGAVISEWTAWSAAFYLNPKLGIEPGFSLGLYPPGVRDLYGRLSLGSITELEELSQLLRFFETDLLILRDDELAKFPFSHELIQPTFGLNLVRVPLARSFKPERLCHGDVRFAQLLKFSPEMKLLSSTSIRPISPDENCDQVLKSLTVPAKDGEIRAFRTWANPEPLSDLRQILGPNNSGRFGALTADEKGNLKLVPASELRKQLGQPTPPGSLSVDERFEVIDSHSFEMQGRLPHFKRVGARLVCESYQDGLEAFLTKAEDYLITWQETKDVTERNRHMVGIAVACRRPHLARPAQKARLADLCTNFHARLAQRAGKFATDQSVLNVGEAILMDLHSDTPVANLVDLSPKDLLQEGRIGVGLQKSPRPILINSSGSEVIASGQFALWWQKRFGLSLGAEYDSYVSRYAKLYKSEFNYDIFAVRWWAEALAQDYRDRKSPEASEWMHLFFRATETMMSGPSRESFPGCLGPQASGLPAIQYMNHNNSLLLEGLGFGREADFPWWSEKDEELLEKLLSCTISMQARAPFWPREEWGRFLYSPSTVTSAPDIQGHFLNALGMRLDQDEINCD